MAETQPSKSERKRERQPISVPFIWEERPGLPKKDWKPFIQPVNPPPPPPPPPPKFVVSIPFGWEEKPGTPLQPRKGSEVVVYSGGNDESWDSELETCSVGTDDSFTSAKSLLANGLISTAAISKAIPVEEELQSHGSPASESGSTSSYATGTTSLAGATFLEWLFPLLVPNSNLGPSQQAKELLHGSQGRRPLLTLGELIAMSRRRSCQRKVNKLQKQQSMDFMKRNAFGCCIFGTGSGINQLQLKWKKQLHLKLM